MAGNNAAAIAAQAEFLRPQLEGLMMFSSIFWSRIKTRTDVKAVSNRPARIPFNPLTAADFRAADFDGGDLGLGSAPTEVPGYLSCVSFVQGSQYTRLAEWATDSDEKAIQDYVTLTQKQATDTFGGCLDAIISTGGGANQLDTVVSTTTNGIVVNNANFFQDGQPIDIWSALGGTFRGTVTIESVDSGSNTIWTTAALPAGTTTGDLLLVNGSAGQSNSGVFGITGYNAGGNTGNYMGISKAAYPGKFSTPTINVGGSLTPAVVRALSAKQQLAMGIDNDGADQVAHMNLDMQVAWENASITMQSIILNQVSGDSITDALKKKAPTMIAGREILANPRATPGRIDFLNLKHWFRIETKATDYYDVGGQTLFPAYGASGGLAASNLFYLVIMFQVGNGQPRKSAYLSNITQPPNIFS